MRQQRNGAPLTLFLSYASEDEGLCKELEQHLSLLRHQELISLWNNRQILPGTDLSQEIDQALNSASLILLLISPAFLASDYCYGNEMRRALERQRCDDAQVIPILVRPVDWQKAPFAHLQYLPSNGKAITACSTHDEGWLAVSKGIRLTVEQMRDATQPTLSYSIAKHQDRHSQGTTQIAFPSNIHTLSSIQRRELVDLLFACETMSRKEAREVVVGELRNEIRSSLSRDHQNAKFDIRLIVNACLNYSMGLHELIEIVQSYERSSWTMKQVTMFMDNVSPEL